MFSSFYNGQQALLEYNDKPKTGDLLKAGRLKTTAKQVTTTLVSFALAADPLLWPVLQAGFDQVKGLCQLIKAAATNE